MEREERTKGRNKAREARELLVLTVGGYTGPQRAS
jgi:hypothetical protein